MITLITGMPGNGKTLYALNFIKRMAEQQGREVYYSGIPELMLPWTEFEAEKWYELPKGSIIVIDECQRLYRKRAMGSKVPLYVSELETHRHNGYDIILITQEPSIIDVDVRRLVGQHFNCIRIFGTESSTVHEFTTCRDRPDKNKKDSVKHIFKFPKESYKWYKSAEVHTVRRNIPARLYILAVIPFLIGGCIWYVKDYLQHKTPLNAEQQKTDQNGDPIKPAPAGAQPGIKHSMTVQEKLDDVREYVRMNEPRIAGLPHTAPKYDELTKPTEVPVPAACVVSASSGCKCFTQQATPIQMPKELCEDIVQHGYFEDFDRTSRQRNQQQQAAPLVTASTVLPDRVQAQAKVEKPEDSGQWVSAEDLPVFTPHHKKIPRVRNLRGDDSQSTSGGA